MRRFVLTLFVATILILPRPVRAAPTPLTRTAVARDSTVSLSYDPANGNVWVNGNNVTMTSFQLESASGAFIVDNVDPAFAPGPFDVVSPEKLFTLRTRGVTELQLGSVLPPGLSLDGLLLDLLVDGSLSPSGTFDQAPGGGPYYCCVPEPVSATLMLIGALSLIKRRRESP